MKNLIETNSLRAIRENVITKIYGIPTYWAKDFWYDENSITVVFEAEKIESEKEFKRSDFQTWVEQNFSGYTNQFAVPCVDDQGEGYYRDVKHILWDVAMQHMPRFIVEDFLNSNLNIGKSN